MATSKHNKRKRIVWAVLVPTLITIGLLFYIGRIVLPQIFPLDFSQDYRTVEGVDGIVFRGWDGRCYQRCFWGLRPAGDDLMADLGNTPKSDVSVEILQSLTDTDKKITQSLYSPDGRYILYCEIEYGYFGSGVTDDEYCYYRVYDLESGEITTVYQGYRRWYDLSW
ncbi:MAG: hypothetical protein NC398_07015 [Acetatifactor muris]|nr:hypothetical protein [Acetatifactor muris]MCM1525687.1 hypothetical protein [Bacteroides sp.]